MSLYNVLRTGVSGMEAQSYKLATVADNVANVNTVGYKRSDTEFSSLLLKSGTGNYESGAVEAKIHTEISRQGGLSYTLSKTDVAIQGDGFFVVQDKNGGNFLTRAGSFVVDGQSGNLVNAGGFSLMGFPSTDGKEPSITLNGTAGLEPVSLDQMNMKATPSTVGEFTSSLPQSASAVGAAAHTAGDNQLDSVTTKMSSMVSYDDRGNPVTLDVYWTKVQDFDPLATPPTDPKWEVVVYNQADKSTSNPQSSFPYTPGDPPLGSNVGPARPAWLAKATVTFSPSTGAITEIDSDQVPGLAPAIAVRDGPVDPRDPSQLAVLQIALPNATKPLALDITGTKELGNSFVPLKTSINGNAPETVKGVTISEDGRVFAQFNSGVEVEYYRLPLANVPAPDQMESLSGNVFRYTAASGDLRINLPNEAGNGKLVVGAVEQSNVDLGTELTEMIVAQRGYTANSKSFQTANDLLDVLMSLKR